MDCDWETVSLLLVRYCEIGLKSTPVRRRFENILKDNMLTMLAADGVEAIITFADARYFIETDDIERCADSVKKVFGIASLSIVEECTSDLEDICRIAADYSVGRISEGPPSRWIDATNAIGIISQSGRYGGTYAQTDIAFEFASWISVEFRLYLVKEFQRLKMAEQQLLGWTAKRELSKINYRIHTDAIKQNLIPAEVSEKQVSLIYANEADVLNVALFGMTAKEWREKWSIISRK